jgi:hypothetical protein
MSKHPLVLEMAGATPDVAVEAEAAEVDGGAGVEATAVKDGWTPIDSASGRFCFRFMSVILTRPFGMQILLRS